MYFLLALTVSDSLWFFLVRKIFLPPAIALNLFFGRSRDVLIKFETKFGYPNDLVCSDQRRF